MDLHGQWARCLLSLQPSKLTFWTGWCGNCLGILSAGQKSKNLPEWCQTIVFLYFMRGILKFLSIRDILHEIDGTKKTPKKQHRVFQTYNAKHKRANFNIVPDKWTYLSMYFFSANKVYVGFPVGQHLYSGIWRYVSRNSPWSPVCFPLHCFWNNPEWHAHLHPLQ